jgi:hypothetical protein
LRGYPETFEAFEALKKAGKVRHLGVSAHNDPAGVLGAALDMKVYSVAMVAYNIVNGRYLDEVLTRARAEDFGVIAMKVARPVYPGPGRAEASPERLRALDAQVEGDSVVPKLVYTPKDKVDGRKAPPDNDFVSPSHSRREPCAHPIVSSTGSKSTASPPSTCKRT